MKKIIIGFAGIATALALIPMFAAFEAHVINVTAKIENALSVPVEPLDFGTVFPQEYLVKRIPVGLSQSFLDEPRVDDVEYVIRQKPKCAITSLDGTTFDSSVANDGTHLFTRTGHVFPGTVPDPALARYHQFEGYYVDCGFAPRELTAEEQWTLLPMLCPYLSKHEDSEDGSETDNDMSLDAFHNPFSVSTTTGAINWLEAKGRLAKSVQDIHDMWLIDLAVPCFGGYCAQDWAEFVERHHIGEGVNADHWTQPIENEHKVFGCDLWIEVYNISLPGFGCAEELDMMLVVDRSGSIDPIELTDVKNALNAFVTAVAPTNGGVHMGQSSFTTNGTLDLDLTGDETAVHTAINALVSGGSTNLLEGITLATDEMDDAHAHERAAVKDVMLILTDGNPNVPGGTAAQDAKDAADAARLAGIEVFVVGVGDNVDATYLQTIADDANHYFAVTDFADLQAKLLELVECDENGQMQFNAQGDNEEQGNEGIGQEIEDEDGEGE
jgi:uncharacterized protein YegL